MNLLYKMFVDGTPLSEGQIKSLISAGLVVRDGNQLKPVRATCFKELAGIQRFM